MSWPNICQYLQNSKCQTSSKKYETCMSSALKRPTDISCQGRIKRKQPRWPPRDLESVSAKKKKSKSQLLVAALCSLDIYEAYTIPLAAGERAREPSLLNNILCQELRLLLSSEQNLLQMCKKMNSKTAKYIGTSMDIKNHRIAKRVKSSDFFFLMSRLLWA